MSSSKIRVLYISHGHPDFDKGGAELAAYYMYKSMKDSDVYEPFFLARTDKYEFTVPGTSLFVHDDDDHCIFLYSGGPSYDYFFDTAVWETLDLRAVGYYKEVLQEIQPQIIHFHHFHHLGADFISYAKQLLPDVRIFMTLHEMIAICPHYGSMLTKGKMKLCIKSSPHKCKMCFPEKPLRDFLLRERWFKFHFAHVEKFIPPSEFLKSRYVEWGLEEERIKVIDYGRPIWPRPERPQRKEGQPLVVGFFGQIVFHKGADVVLRAAAEYLRRKKIEEESSISQSELLPEIRFVMHGALKLPKKKSEEFEELLDECKEIVTYQGPYDMDRMQDLYKGVECSIVPSLWWENSPLTIQEAFMAGIPVLCSNVGGMAEKVTDRVNGLHFLVGNHFDLLDKLIELANSPTLYNKLVEGIPSIMSEEEMAERMHELYRR